MIGDGQELIDWLASRMQAADEAKAETNGHAKVRTSSSAPTVDDEEIIRLCRAAENAPKFEALYDRGDVHTYHGGDDSAADLGLLSILAFYTQDPTQLGRIFSDSALGQRSKWRRRRDYRKRTIDKALAGVGEIYQGGRERKYHHHRGYGGAYGDDDIRSESNIVWFHELGEPKPRRFVIEKVARKGYPMVIYGAGGVAKSFAALAGGIALASDGGLRSWLGLRVLEHGYVCYLDFELDVDEQHARVVELCNGLGVDVPKRLAYLSGRGRERSDAFAEAHAFADEYKAVAVIVDSVGQAIAGDADKNHYINEFYRRHIETFSLYGTTPILVDHQGKLQAGEKHKDKSIIGGVYKTNNARGVLQFVLDEYDKDEHRLDIRVRVPKTNFEPPEPFGISITFAGDRVSIDTRVLPDEELLDEEREPLDKRVYAALISEPLSVIDLVRITGAAEGSVRNTLSKLMREGRVDATTARPKLYYRAGNPPPDGPDFVTREKPKKAATHLTLISSPSTSPRVSDDDDIDDGTQAGANENKNAQACQPVSQENPTTVEEFFANPPDWLPELLEKYHQDPERYFGPLCHTVAAAVYKDGSVAGEDVAEEIERILEEGAQT